MPLLAATAVVAPLANPTLQLASAASWLVRAGCYFRTTRRYLSLAAPSARKRPKQVTRMLNPRTSTLTDRQRLLQPNAARPGAPATTDKQRLNRPATVRHLPKPVPV